MMGRFVLAALAALCVGAMTPAAPRTCAGPPESPSAGGSKFACTPVAANPLSSDGGRGNGTACAFCAGHEATAHLLGVAASLRRLKERECSKLVVYGVAFGAKYLRRWPNRTLLGARTVRDLHAAHGRCFFKFMLRSDVKGVAKRVPFPAAFGSHGKAVTARARAPQVGANTKRQPEAFFVRHNQKVDDLDLLIALDGALLPWREAGSQRRNVKILKLLGPVLFPWTERLLWIDSKLRLGALDPRAVVDATTSKRGACAAFVGLPFHANAYGPAFSTMAAPSFAAHAANLARSGVESGDGYSPWSIQESHVVEFSRSRAERSLRPKIGGNSSRATEREEGPALTVLDPGAIAPVAADADG